MKGGRLFNILYYLLNKGQATAGELAEKFEVSVRTIYRDIDALSGAGIPVYTEAGRSGGIRLLGDFVLERTVLSEEEKRKYFRRFRACPLRGIILKSRLWKSSRRCFIPQWRTGMRWIFQDGEEWRTIRKSLRR